MFHRNLYWYIDDSTLIVSIIALTLVAAVWSYFDRQTPAPSLRFFDVSVATEVRTVAPPTKVPSAVTYTPGTLRYIIGPETGTVR